MKIVISTGGTGGHIYPAIALARYIEENYDDVDLLFTGSSKRMEKDIVTKEGFEFFGYNISSGTKSVFHKIGQLIQMSIGIVIMYFKFLFKKPDVVIGFGAYITAPTLMAAKFLNIPIILHEQNSSMGKTNEMFFKSSTATIICYKNLLEEYDNDNMYLLGNPRASEVKDIKRDRSILEQFDLEANKKTVLIVMGSLGSESVNNAMYDLLPLFGDSDYQVIFVTGNKHYSVYKNLETKDNVVILPYVNQAEVLANVDLVIARGGATTAAEICALGVASIIIPSPYVSNNHQYINALQLEEVNATKIIKEEDLTSELLIETIEEIINSDDIISEMSAAAKTLAYPNASEDISKLIMEKISND